MIRVLRQRVLSVYHTREHPAKAVRRNKTSLDMDWLQVTLHLTQQIARVCGRIAYTISVTD